MDTRPIAELEGCRISHLTLDARVAALTDAQAKEPSLLPGWSRGHLLTHLARNADSIVRRLEGAMRNEIADQYLGGEQGRAQEIEAGANRSAEELIADLSGASAAVDAAFAAMPNDAWERLGRSYTGAESPVSGLALTRWKEVEIHLLDLDLGYGPSDWPDAFVESALPGVLRSLKRRADTHALLAWAINRSAGAPELGPWG